MAKVKDDKPKEIQTDIIRDVPDSHWPIIYSPEYNITFFGFEKMHPFDSGKWGRIHQFLIEDGMVTAETTVRPIQATNEDLMIIHTRSYINSLGWSHNVAKITEIPFVCLLPNFIVQRRVLRPFRFQTAGTVLAASLAIKRGWAINLGGGFHHCCSYRGGGFCAYADITLAIHVARAYSPKKDLKVMIVDLDAHQGNGHERDFGTDENTYIMDVYNRGIYPFDDIAKRSIRRKVELNHFTGDDEYLDLVESHLEDALNEFEADLVMFNAGTDILEGDPLGHLSITREGVILRDEIVFAKARSRGIPVCMVTSGGYQRTTARIIADSILNLKNKGHIGLVDTIEPRAVI